MLEFFTNPIFAQSTGVIGALLLIYCYQCKSRENIIIVISIGIAFLAVHMFQLGGITGGVLNTVAFIRNLVFYRKNSHAWATWPWWPYIFTGILIVLTFFFWQGLESIFPLIAITIATFAFWMDEPKMIRRLSLVMSLAWMPYAYVIGSPSIFGLQIFIITSILIAMWRLDRTTPMVKET